ncbi:MULTISPECIES: CsbD family protein [unclassified Arthrobacter]|uniref:CsbD family protein n=1 Tax=unclassified Arthrobacter TaxID=235627 RepID=UPI0014917A7D|nr:MULTISPECIES: CsbD family protein [unclassified Arthrobacter]MBE0008518.1 CsbD family protein [Arthrobacter sp. AET 35A]NOJ59250.1 CsbD family protein [Arthrobacter sp. 260]NOJ62258.1 CsbD family protein [Arthrobacter sp. 147(2020)]
MSFIDKAKNKAEELTGKAKEAVGDATNNQDLKVEGQADQGSAHTKQAGENIKDVFKGDK